LLGICNFDIIYFKRYLYHQAIIPKMQKENKTLKHKFSVTRSNVFNVLFLIILIVLLVNPAAKGLLIQGLMKIGLFQPDVKTDAKPLPVTNSIRFEDAQGNVTSIQSLHGKVLFINFWATWCLPCLAEMPSINALQQKLQNNKDILIMMVDADGNLPASIPFIKKHNYNLTVYKALDAVPSGMIGNAIPTTVVINKQGKIVFKHEGVADYDNSKVYDYLKKLAAE
jgi:thiol-disulfide isomerase/thioredoxin